MLRSQIEIDQFVEKLITESNTPFDARAVIDIAKQNHWLMPGDELVITINVNNLNEEQIEKWVLIQTLKGWTNILAVQD